MIQRGGEVVIRMLADVKQATIGPLIRRTISPGATVYTDEYDIYPEFLTICIESECNLCYNSI
jgi:hypothetical protein